MTREELDAAWADIDRRRAALNEEWTRGYETFGWAVAAIAGVLCAAFIGLVIYSRATGLAG